MYAYVEDHVFLKYIINKNMTFAHKLLYLCVQFYIKCSKQCYATIKVGKQKITKHLSLRCDVHRTVARCTFCSVFILSTWLVKAF